MNLKLLFGIVFTFYFPIIGYTTYLLFKAYRKLKLTPDLCIFALSATVISSGILEVLSKLILDYSLASFLIRLNIVIGTFEIILVLLIFSNLYPWKLNWLVFAISLLVYGMFISSLFLVSGGLVIIWNPELQGYIAQSQTGFTLLFNVTLGVIVNFYTLFVIYHYLTKYIRTQKHLPFRVRLQGYLFFLYIELSLVGCSLIGYLGSIYHLSYTALLFYIVVLAGTVLLLGAYIISPSAPHLIVSEPIALYVVSDTGVPLFQFMFTNKEQHTDTFVGGILSAINEFCKKTLGVDENFSMIYWRDLTIISKIEGNIMFILLSRKYFKYIEVLLDRFSKEFLKKCSMLISPNKKTYNLSEIKKRCRYIVGDTFSFIEVNSIDHTKKTL